MQINNPFNDVITDGLPGASSSRLVSGSLKNSWSIWKFTPVIYSSRVIVQISADIASKTYPLLVLDRLNKIILMPQQIIISAVFTFMVAPSDKKLRNPNELNNQPLKPVKPKHIAAIAKSTAGCLQGCSLAAVCSKGYYLNIKRYLVCLNIVNKYDKN